MKLDRPWRRSFPIDDASIPPVVRFRFRAIQVAVALATMATGGTTGCLPLNPYTCTSSDQCQRDGAGLCGPNGSCAYADSNCASGYRYEDQAGSTPGICVEPEPPSSSTSGLGVSDESSTGAAESSTGEPLDTTGAIDPMCGAFGEACCLPADADSECDPGLACLDGICGCALAIDSGANHHCVTTSTDQLLCWGDNSSSQLGTFAGLASFEPIDALSVVFSSTAKPLAVSLSTTHSCAVRGPANPVCWGGNDAGQSSPSDEVDIVVFENEADAVVFGAGGQPADIAAGDAFSCATTISPTGENEPTLTCWGDNTNGQLGTPEPLIERIVSQVLPERVLDIEAGGRHACALGQSGTAYCWGDNTQGQLGVEDEVTGPTEIPLTDVRLMALGAAHSCFVTATELTCVGANDRGQLGNGSQVSQEEFVQPNLDISPSDIQQIVAANNHTCVLDQENTLYCWGDDTQGQLRLPMVDDDEDRFSSTPQVIDIQGLGTVQEIGTGASSTCILTTQGQIHCWGDNSLGQLGTSEDAGISTVALNCGLL